MKELPRGAVTFIRVARRLATAFGIQGDFPGAVMGNVQPVVLAEDLTGQRSLFPKGGWSFEASGNIGQDGARYNGFLLYPRVSPIDPGNIQRLVRVRSLSAWSMGNNASGFMYGWGVYDRNQTVPALLDGAVIIPTRRDARQAFDTSLYSVTTGLIAGSGNSAAFTSTRRWARHWGAGTPTPTPAARFDPMITLRAGDFLYVMNSTNNIEWAFSIAWDEIPCSEQENAGDNA